MKKLFILILIALFPNVIFSGNHQSQILKAYATLDTELWMSVVDSLQQENLSSEETKLLLAYQYGLVGYCVESGDKKNAKRYLKKHIEQLDKIKGDKKLESLFHAHMAAVYGFQINLITWRAPILGPKSLKSAQNSLDLDDKLFFGYEQMGHLKLNIPKAFGGSKEGAVRQFEKALNLFKSSHADYKNDWRYYNLLKLTIDGKKLIGEDFQKLTSEYKTINNFK